MIGKHRRDQIELRRSFSRFNPDCQTSLFNINRGSVCSNRKINKSGLIWTLCCLHLLFITNTIHSSPPSLRGWSLTQSHPCLFSPSDWKNTSSQQTQKDCHHLHRKDDEKNQREANRWPPVGQEETSSWSCRSFPCRDGCRGTTREWSHQEEQRDQQQTGWSKAVKCKKNLCSFY